VARLQHFNGAVILTVILDRPERRPGALQMREHRGAQSFAQLRTFLLFFDRGFRIDLLIHKELVSKNVLLSDKKFRAPVFNMVSSGRLLIPQ
jgi:hypothetical protein